MWSVVSRPVVPRSHRPISAFYFLLSTFPPWSVVQLLESVGSEDSRLLGYAKGVFSRVLNCQVACHCSLWRFWLRGTSADEHRKCDEGLDGTFHLCHIFRREAPAPAMLHALKLWLTPLRWQRPRV